MNRPTFAQFRQRVAGYAESVGSPLGVCINDIPALAALVNEATESWFFDPQQPEEGWWFTWSRMVFNVSRSNPYITNPRGVARIILMDVCKRPTKVQNGFYEFLDYGPGLQPKGCLGTKCGQLTQAYDREFVATLGQLSVAPQTIRIYPTDPRDVDKTVIVQGTDQNGNTVYGTDPSTNQTILGEIVTLALPFADTLNTFVGPDLSGLEKDVTFGPVTFMQVDPTTGDSAALSTMEPSETSAAYRRYLVNGLPCNCCEQTNGQVQVTAQCKLEYVPVASDPDYLLIPNVPALIAECESIRYSVMDNSRAAKMSVDKHQRALGLLFGQLDHYLGRERPAISVPIFGSSRLRTQPL